MKRGILGERDVAQSRPEARHGRPFGNGSVSYQALNSSSSVAGGCMRTRRRPLRRAVVAGPAPSAASRLVSPCRPPLAIDRFNPRKFQCVDLYSISTADQHRSGNAASGLAPGFERHRLRLAFSSVSLKISISVTCILRSPAVNRAGADDRREGRFDTGSAPLARGKSVDRSDREAGHRQASRRAAPSFPPPPECPGPGALAGRRARVCVGCEP